MSKDTDRRTDDAQELLVQLQGRGPDMDEKDQAFYLKMLEAFTYHDGSALSYRKPRVTQKQLFWLRDLRDRYALGTEG